MRLIDADALIADWRRINDITEDDCGARFVGYSEIPAWINRQPTIEPERKTGRWVKARGSWCTPGGDPVWECSECGKGVHVYGIEHNTYGSDVADGQWVSCPNCGAKMGAEKID